MKVCRICLSKDGRLYPITSNGLRSLYHQLTGVPKLEMDVDARLPQWVCAECGLRLLSYNKLRQKSLRSQQILCQLWDGQTYVTEDDIDQIDREQNGLQSNLSYAVILDYRIIQENDEDNKITYKTDCKPELIEEFTIEIEDAVVKTEVEVDSSIEGHDTAMSDLENDSDFKNDPFSDCELVSKKKITSSSKLKTKPKKKQDYIQKSVNKYMESLMKKVNKLKLKKAKAVKKECKKKVVKKEKDVISDNKLSINGMFTVQTFSPEEQMVEFERRQYSKSYTCAPFKCSICFKGFNDQTVFDSHQSRHIGKAGLYDCEMCKLWFRRGAYNGHVESHTYKYTCNECQFITKRRSVAVLHSQGHKGKVYKCPQCPLQFISQTTYLSHLRIKHVSQFVCQYCGFSFVNAKGVSKHIALKHARENVNDIVSTDGPECARCNIKFVSDKALSTHLRVSHPKKTTAKKRNEFCETRLASIICEICGAKVAGGSKYRLHIERHHPSESLTQLSTTTQQNVFNCRHCGWGFNSNIQMLQHEAVHTAHTPYECDYCKKTFRTKLTVKAHIMNKHLSKKCDNPNAKDRHPCSICWKQFANVWNLNRHMTIHTDLRPFTCEICGSSFKSKSELKMHTKHVHLKVPWPKRQRAPRQGNNQKWNN